MLIALWGTRALLKLSGNKELEASPDLRVFLFTAGICVLTGILFGLIPALRSRRMAVAPTLKTGSQSGAQRSCEMELGKELVTGAGGALLLVLFIAGLLVRSLQNIRNIDLGYNREHLLMVATDPMAAGYSKEKIASFGNELAAKISRLPGVRAETSYRKMVCSAEASPATVSR